jgi:hypothetical protein
MLALTVVVTVDSEDQVPNQMLGAVEGHGIVIKLQFLFKGGEEALHHGVVSAAGLGRHAVADLAAFEQFPVDRRSVMAPLVRMDQKLVRFDLAVPQSTV